MNHLYHALAQLSSQVAAGTGEVYAPKGLFLPEQASTFAPASDWLFDFIHWVSLFFFVAIVGLMFWFMFRYRRRTETDPVHAGAHHNLPLEIAWSILPAFLLVYMFYAGFVGYMDQVKPPADAMEITVEAKQWSWKFTYPNGWEDDKLVVPVDTNVVLTMHSTDVLHSLFVPEFRAKMDIVPGKYSKVWFNAVRCTTADPYGVVPGDDYFHIFCAEYCGTSHSNMLAKVFVLPQSEEGVAEASLRAGRKMPTYQHWLAVASDNSVIPPANRGEKRASINGCFSCHAMDGTKLVGPSWLGIWGKQEELEGGTSILVDETYIRESILTPNAKLVKGYPGGGMNSFKGLITERDIEDIIAYIKTLAAQ